MTTASEEVTRQGKKVRFLLIGGAVLTTALVVLAVAFFLQARNSQTTNDTDAKATSERIIRRVGELYMLPGGEVPTVAKIQKRDSLHGNQDFYKDAQNGDYVLVYQKSKMAILYRESINKLVKVSPVILDSAPANR